MPPVTTPRTIAPPQRPSGDGHAGHANVAALPSPSPAGSASSSFSTALVQAAGRYSSGNVPGRHGNGDVGGFGGETAVSASAPHGANLTHPRHFPLGAPHASGGHDLQEKALAVRAYRQQVIASNIANADTPGYQAVDIDVNAAMCRANGAPLTLNVSALYHLSSAAVPLYPLTYAVPLQPNADGNTVDMDVERAKFAENALMYEFSLDRVSGHYKHLMEMLQNLKD